MLQVHQQKTIAVIGDSILDAYDDGDYADMDTPIFRIRSRKYVPGGAGNVARNIQSLGGEPLLYSVVGVDPPSERYIWELKKAGIGVDCLVKDSRWTICIKTRLLHKGAPLIRIDRESASPAVDDNKLYSQMTNIPSDCKTEILSDYAKGCLAPGLVNRISRFVRVKGKRLFVDSKSATIPSLAYVYKPNLREFEKMVGAKLEKMEEIRAAALAFKRHYRIQHLIVTMDRRGLLWMDEKENGRAMPSTVVNPVDSCGAGDSFLAALALESARGKAMEEAIYTANLAAGAACRHVGTYAVRPSDIAVRL